MNAMFVRTWEKERHASVWPTFIQFENLDSAPQEISSLLYIFPFHQLSPHSEEFYPQLNILFSSYFRILLSCSCGSSLFWSFSSCHCFLNQSFVPGFHSMQLLFNIQVVFIRSSFLSPSSHFRRTQQTSVNWVIRQMAAERANPCSRRRQTRKTRKRNGRRLATESSLSCIDVSLHFTRSLYICMSSSSLF